jgi:hypothetical protein
MFGTLLMLIVSVGYVWLPVLRSPVKAASTDDDVDSRETETYRTEVFTLDGDCSEDLRPCSYDRIRPAIGQ